LVLGAAALQAQGEFPTTVQRVPLAAVTEAMTYQAGLGYHMGISANSPRLTTGVLLALVRAARDSSPEGPPLMIHHDDWYAAYQTATGLADDAIPDFIALQQEFGQDQYVDYRAAQNRVEVTRGEKPDLVVTVLVGWHEGPDAVDEYRYVDSASSPAMLAVNKRIIRYRLLAFPDMTVQDGVEGIIGRPMGGVLGAMFRVIGPGRVVWSRFGVSEDGLLVTHSRAKKGFASVTQTTTTYPDGTIEKDVPDDRPDLEAIEARLEEKLDVEYR
jgi:hypothetical protein